MSLSKITVNDIIYFVMSKGHPVSGLAIRFLMDGFTPWTEIEEEFFEPETYKEIIEWKEENANNKTNRKSQ